MEFAQLQSRGVYVTRMWIKWWNTGKGHNHCYMYSNDVHNKTTRIWFAPMTRNMFLLFLDKDSGSRTNWFCRIKCGGSRTPFCTNIVDGTGSTERTTLLWCLLWRDLLHRSRFFISALIFKRISNILNFLYLQSLREVKRQKHINLRFVYTKRKRMKANIFLWSLSRFNVNIELNSQLTHSEAIPLLLSL